MINWSIETYLHYGAPVSELKNSKWRKNAAINHAVNGWDNGSSPVRHQTDIWTDLEYFFTLFDTHSTEYTSAKC